MWTSGNLSALVISILLHKFGVGDHRMILSDFDLDQITERKVRIYRPQMRRLECENKKLVSSYNAMAWKLLQFHSI